MVDGTCGAKIHKLCDMTGFCDYVSVYLERNWQSAIQTMTVTQATLKKPR
jgi:hypothetical protein